MKNIAMALLLAAATGAAGHSAPSISTNGPMNGPAQGGSMRASSISGEGLGTVSFPVSCSASLQVSFNRGVALLHDFWYSEAQSQFEQIAKADPDCAMAHWGIAMSLYHEIWERPGGPAMKLGWEEIEKAQSPAAKTGRERDYIAALAVFYRPGSQDYLARAAAYSAAMGALYREYPGDVDAGAFYALSRLASAAPNDTSLTHAHEALAVLEPLFVRYPDNPGVNHYIIHSCDNPAMAREGLAAAEHYGSIAPAGAHASHMPGHIFARLGMWQQDIHAQLESIHAAEQAEAHGENGLSDEPHSYDFLLYAYLQSGQDADARAVIVKTASVLDRIAAMPGMAEGHMHGMAGYYRTKYPVFYDLETRDWQRAAALEPVPGALPEYVAMTWWARAIADGHLHRAGQAKADLAQYEAQIAEVRRSPDAYAADSTTTQIQRSEVMAWASFAVGEQDDALHRMRMAADLQDKVGQGEVDIPAREMLADMLLELHKPQQALAEYRVALQLSPNRFNGLYHAGLAAEEAGDRTAAAGYYAALLKSTGNGTHSARPELAHAKSFVASGRAVASQAATR